MHALTVSVTPDTPALRHQLAIGMAPSQVSSFCYSSSDDSHISQTNQQEAYHVPHLQPPQDLTFPVK